MGVFPVDIFKYVPGNVFVIAREERKSNQIFQSFCWRQSPGIKECQRVFAVCRQLKYGYLFNPGNILSPVSRENTVTFAIFYF